MYIMKILRAVIIATLCISFTLQQSVQKTVFSDQLAYYLVLSTIEKDTPKCKAWQRIGQEGRERIARKIFTTSTNVCEIYELDLKIFLRHMKKESRFRPWAVSHKAAYGLMQVQPKWHSGVLYKIQSNKLGRYLQKKKREGKPINHDIYFKNVEYNLHVAGYLYRAWLDQYNGYYPFMLSTYFAGGNHPITRALIKQPGLLYRRKHRVYNDIKEVLK